MRITTNDTGLYPWLIRRPVRECVTWALVKLAKYWVLLVNLAHSQRKPIFSIETLCNHTQGIVV